MANQELVAEVQKLLDKGPVKAVDPCPDQFISRIFLVPKKNGSFRPIINLGLVNHFMESLHFKKESLATLKDLLRPGKWMASVDLKDACLSVANWEGYRKYLRFSYSSVFYKLPCIPFGLCSAPKSFHEAAKTCNSSTLPPRHQVGYVPGQYACDGSGKRRPRETIVIDSNTPGLCSEQREVTADPVTDHTLLGFPDQFHGDKNQTDEKEGDTISDTMQQKPFLLAQELAQLIGKMTALFQRVHQAPLWYCKFQCLNNQMIQQPLAFNQPVLLNQESQLELQW